MVGGLNFSLKRVTISTIYFIMHRMCSKLKYCCYRTKVEDCISSAGSSLDLNSMDNYSGQRLAFCCLATEKKAQKFCNLE